MGRVRVPLCGLFLVVKCDLLPLALPHKPNTSQETAIQYNNHLGAFSGCVVPPSSAVFHAVQNSPPHWRISFSTNSRSYGFYTTTFCEGVRVHNLSIRNVVVRAILLILPQRATLVFVTECTKNGPCTTFPDFRSYEIFAMAGVRQVGFIGRPLLPDP